MTTATEPTTQSAKGILVTEKALAKVRSAMAKEGISPEQGGLRLGVQGGGCSGLSYNIRFDTQPRERDRIFQFGDVRVFVDPKSFIYLHGMTLDYQETLMQQGLRVRESAGLEILRLRNFVLGLILARADHARWNSHHGASVPAQHASKPGRATEQPVVNLCRGRICAWSAAGHDRVR